ncbi:hypothetical protein ACFL2T_00725 [Elusimicrobiota bacterium]
MTNGETKEVDSRQRNDPIIECQINKSKDGRWIIHRTIITDIKPVNYFKKVIQAN